MTYLPKTQGSLRLRFNFVSSRSTSFQHFCIIMDFVPMPHPIESRHKSEGERKLIYDVEMLAEPQPTSYFDFCDRAHVSTGGILREDCNDRMVVSHMVVSHISHMMETKRYKLEKVARGADEQAMALDW